MTATPVTDQEAIASFVVSLRALDRSPHTIRSYEATVTRLLAWIARQPGADWRSPTRRQLRAWLASIANQLGVSLDEAFARYADGCPSCGQVPCVCSM